MKKSIEKGIKDSGFNIKEKMNDVELEEFIEFSKGCQFCTHSEETNFLLWKILKKLEERR